jgi:polyhydroxyalkanoate synthesis regulator phasin
MIDLIKKSLLAGVGAAVVTKEKVEQVLDEFVREGKVSTKDARTMAEKIAEQGRREFDEICSKLAGKLRDATARGDDSANVRLTALEQRVRVLEAKLAAPETRAGEP